MIIGFLYCYKGKFGLIQNRVSLILLNIPTYDIEGIILV